MRTSVFEHVIGCAVLPFHVWKTKPVPAGMYTMLSQTTLVWFG